jgi:hypothetical protein
VSKKLYIKGGLGSASAKRLAQGLSTRLGYKVYRSIKTFPKKQALRYGEGVNKIQQYEWFLANNIPALEFTYDKTVVQQWINDDCIVFSRGLLNASCGKGIQVWDQLNGWDGVVDAPVYTKYKKKKREFRVHVFRDSVVRVVEKKLRKDWNGPRESKIRNLANGYVFCSCTDEPEGLRPLAIKAAGVVGSDFRGVDIGFNEHKQELFVIEVNSAPGIEGSNVEAYIEAILKDQS